MLKELETLIHVRFKNMNSHNFQKINLQSLLLNLNEN